MNHKDEALIVMVKEGGALIFYKNGWCVDSASGDLLGFNVDSIRLAKDDEKLQLLVEMTDRQIFVKNGLDSDWSLSSFSKTRYLAYTVLEHQNDIKQIENWSENWAND